MSDNPDPYVGLDAGPVIGATEYLAERRKQLSDAIRHTLNCHSAENGSNTPDFILADYLLACLDAYDAAVWARSKWYGNFDAPGRNAPAPNSPAPARQEPA